MKMQSSSLNINKKGSNMALVGMEPCNNNRLNLNRSDKNLKTYMLELPPNQRKGRMDLDTTVPSFDSFRMHEPTTN